MNSLLSKELPKDQSPPALGDLEGDVETRTLLQNPFSG